MQNKIMSPDNNTHKKQILWQIWLPLGLSIVLVIILAAMAALTTSTNPIEGGRLSSISLIIVLIPALIMCFFILLFLAAVIFGVYKLIQVIPEISFKAQVYLGIAVEFIHLWSDRIVKPILVFRGWLAGINRFMTSITPRQK